MKYSRYIKGLNKGNKKIFKEIFDDFFPALVNFANRFCNDIEMAEDIVQETFIGLWDNRKTLYSEVGLKSYLYQTTKNKSLNQLRRLKLADKHSSSEPENRIEPDFESIIIEEEALRIFYRVIDDLPDKPKEVVLLTLRGLKREEIAEQMNISVNTVKYHKQKAFVILRENLKNTFIYLLIFELLNYPF